MHIGYLEDSVQLEITVTHVFTSCVHSAPETWALEWEGWRGLAFLRGRRGSGVRVPGALVSWIKQIAFWALGYPQSHFSTSAHVSSSAPPPLLLAAHHAQECGGSHTAGGGSCAPGTPLGFRPVLSWRLWLTAPGSPGSTINTEMTTVASPGAEPPGQEGMSSKELPRRSICASPKTSQGPWNWTGRPSGQGSGRQTSAISHLGN